MWGGFLMRFREMEVQKIGGQKKCPTPRLFHVTVSRVFLRIFSLETNYRKIVLLEITFAKLIYIQQGCWKVEFCAMSPSNSPSISPQEGKKT